MSFNDTTIIINNTDPTTYGELRENAQEGLESFGETEVGLAFKVFGAAHIASAMRGMMHTILALVDEVERVTDQMYDANESV